MRAHALLIVMTMLLVTVTAALPSYVPVTKLDPSRDAVEDIAAAASEAKRTGRHVLVDVEGDWCIWCKRLDAFFDEQKDVAGYPHLFVLDGDGKLLHSQDTGALESGKGHDGGKVLAFLKRWAPQEGTPAR